MSVRVMSFVWDHSRARGTDLLVLLAIADFADDGGKAFPAVETLARKTRISERSVQRAIRTLTDEKELSVLPSGGMRGVNVYTVNLSPRQVDTPDKLTPVNLSPGVTPVTQRGDTHVTRTIKNQKTPQPPASTAGVAGPRTKAHCDKHSKHRNGCPSCARLETARVEAVVAELARAEGCGICEGTHKVLDPETKRPTRRRCDHRSGAVA